MNLSGIVWHHNLWWHQNQSDQNQQLENLRVEIIPGKESKLEDRYSKLLSTSNIRKSEVHKKVS